MPRWSQTKLASALRGAGYHVEFIQLTGADHFAPIFREVSNGQFQAVADDAGFTRALDREGVLGGVSSGAVIHAALRLAEELDEGIVVCVLADGGWKYLSTGAYEGTLDDAEDSIDGSLWA